MVTTRDRVWHVFGDIVFRGVSKLGVRGHKKTPQAKALWFQIIMEMTVMISRQRLITHALLMPSLFASTYNQWSLALFCSLVIKLQKESHQLHSTVNKIEVLFRGGC